MKCLSVRQPWAWLIIHGGGVYAGRITYGRKNIENRKWKTSHRGSLLIHAARTTPDFETWATAEKMYALEYPKADAPNPIPPADELPYGKIIGQVKLIDITREYPWGHWTLPDHWHWILGHPKPVSPIPYRGRPGLFDVPEALLKEANND